MITSAANREVRALRRLRTRENRERRGLVLVEGRAALQEALSAGAVLDRVIATPVGERTSSDLIRLAVGAGAAKVLVAPEIMSLLASTVKPPPVLAVAKRPDLPLATQERVCWLYVSEEQDPGALGAMLRAAVGYGVSLVMTSPRTTDPLDQKVIRASRAAHWRVRIEASLGMEDALARAAEAGMQAYALPEGRPESPPLPSKLLLILGRLGDSLGRTMPQEAIPTSPGLPATLGLPVVLDAWRRSTG